MIEGVLEVRRPNTNDVEREQDAGPPAKLFRDETDAAREAASSGEPVHFFRKRHPSGNYFEKYRRIHKVRNSADRENSGDQPSHEEADSNV